MAILIQISIKMINIFKIKKTVEKMILNSKNDNCYR